MKIGDKVRVEETGEDAEVTSIINGKVTHVKSLKTGQVIDVMDKTITLITILKKVVQIIKSIF
jgi:hypothetical protein